MRIPLRFVLPALAAAVLAFPPRSGAAAGPGAGIPQDSCYSCHARLGGTLGAPAREYLGSVHREAGITCVTCHGGNPFVPGEEAMSRAKGFRGKPSMREIPGFCARCHSNIAMMRQYNLRTDQLAEYRTSVHGKRLYGKNDPNVAVCTSCHGKHGIRRKSDPESTVFRANVPATCGTCHADPAKMKPYGIPADQPENFSKGVHGRILAGKVPGKNPGIAPNCATCHGIHGATPPGVREVSNVCGNCHTLVAEYFRGSPHFTAVQEVGEPKCVTCHGNHDNRRPTLKVFSGTGPGECGSCHEKGSKALEFAGNVQTLLSAIESDIADVRKESREAAVAGRNTDRLQAALDTARNRLIEAGPVVHAFSLDRLFPVVHEAEDALGQARDELRRIRDEQRQRKAVAGYAVTMLLLIAVLLGIKLRLLPKGAPAAGAKNS